MECVILSGIQASGKSTLYKKYFSDTHIRINLDMLQRRSKEWIIFEACVKAKCDIVIDNTNTLRTEREKYITLLKENDYKIIGYQLDNNLEICLARNALRIGRAKIPEEGIRKFAKRYEPLDYSEGFHAISIKR